MIDEHVFEFVVILSLSISYAPPNFPEISL